MTPRPSAAPRVSGGPVFKSSQPLASLSSQVHLDEITQLKARNAALTTSMKEKITQLDEAL
uniref:AlNc14C268G9916 protein n=1 Tax=Albugo laibachii Nc14 TaxID=890382 RepID=F0WU95_9STRA|nr:AlNc14C268G9916 [Albugo laibachii Nc14]|eukprot:CCA24973.1 AlNc14C268G9916 [Albugo laibachii Nc14]